MTRPLYVRGHRQQCAGQKRDCESGRDREHLLLWQGVTAYLPPRPDSAAYPGNQQLQIIGPRYACLTLPAPPPLPTAKAKGGWQMAEHHTMSLDWCHSTGGLHDRCLWCRNREKFLKREQAVAVAPQVFVRIALETETCQCQCLVLK